MNIFEGSRRLLKVVSLLWIAGVIAFVILIHESTPEAHYVINSFGAPPELKEGCPKNSAMEFPNSWQTKTARGNRFSVTLCFRPIDDSSEVYIHYNITKVDGKADFNWVDKAYSKSVKEYTRKFSESFEIPEKDYAKLDQKYRIHWLYTTGEILFLNSIGILLLWGFAWCIGYIARGFLGIKSSSDTKES